MTSIPEEFEEEVDQPTTRPLPPRVGNWDTVIVDENGMPRVGVVDPRLIPGIGAGVMLADAIRERLYPPGTTAAARLGSTGSGSY